MEYFISIMVVHIILLFTALVIYNLFLFTDREIDKTTVSSLLKKETDRLKEEHQKIRESWNVFDIEHFGVNEVIQKILDLATTNPQDFVVTKNVENSSYMSTTKYTLYDKKREEEFRFYKYFSLNRQKIIDITSFTHKWMNKDEIAALVAVTEIIYEQQLASSKQAESDSLNKKYDSPVQEVSGNKLEEFEEKYNLGEV